MFVGVGGDMEWGLLIGGEGLECLVSFAGHVGAGGGREVKGLTFGGIYLKHLAAINFKFLAQIQFMIVLLKISISSKHV